MVPYRTLLFLGLAVGMLGAGYVFAPRPGVAAPPSASVPEAAPVASAAMPAAPTVKASTTLASSRPPVPFVTRSPEKYYVPKESDAAFATSQGAIGAGDLTTASLVIGGATDGGLPPQSDDMGPRDSSRAKAAIELDGYKNVRGLEKGPDGVWRGRAMRGRTEIAIRVDDAGNVSAE